MNYSSRSTYLSWNSKSWFTRKPSPSVKAMLYVSPLFTLQTTSFLPSSIKITNTNLWVLISTKGLEFKTRIPPLETRCKSQLVMISNSQKNQFYFKHFYICTRKVAAASPLGQGSRIIQSRWKAHHVTKIIIIKCPKVNLKNNWVHYVANFK